MTNQNDNITCGACTVAIGAHTNDANCKHGQTVRVFHLTQLNKIERRRLNRAGWDSEPRFGRYADITAGFSKVLASQVIEAWNSGEYHEAAIVKTDSLDWAFQQTNSISHVWNLNDDVEPITDQFKSTSVGDIMIDSSGQAWIVAPMGFEKVTLPEPHHFYATFALGYAMAETREKAIEKLVSNFRADFQPIIRNEKKDGKLGAYVWTVRIDQASRQYGINFYQPQDVPMTDAQEHAVTRATLKAIEFVTTSGEQS